MDSPRSEKLETRFSTPVSNLDDHRNQKQIPMANTNNSSRRENASRRGTITSTYDARPDLLQVDERLRDAGPVSRDFEQAVTDDDASRNEDATIGDPASPVPSPGRGLSRRIQDTMEKFGRSRDRSPSSSRSTSPRNSVDAFADGRRRERANTFGSRGRSEVDLPLQRTVSGGTHHRRPTFSNASIRPVDNNEAEVRPQEDVCFPQPEEPSKTFRIDFEELEEFVAESTRGRTAVPVRQRHSFSSQGQKPKSIDDCTNIHKGVPQIVTHAASPMGRGSGVTCTAADDLSLSKEKNCDDFLGEKPPFDRRPSVAETNRFSFFSSETEHTIHAPELGDLIMPGETFRDLFELPQDGGAWWLDVLNPSEDELEMFQKAFGIHRLTAEDIQSQEIREKVELFKQYYFVCFRSFYQMDKNSDDYMEPVNVYMVVFRDGIITFTYALSPHAANVRKRIGTLRNYIDLTSDWICYAMVDNIVDSFGPVIRSIELETDQIEDQVFVARSEDFSSLLRQIGVCRKKVMSLMRLLGGKADVIKGFAKRCNEQYSVTPRGEIGLYLGDIQDHVVTMMSNLGHFEKMLSRSHSNYLAQLSVDNIAQGNRANE
ncbi:MAG: hypothetical protein Q9187_005114, partial [Circinaria calcarea]